MPKRIDLDDAYGLKTPEDARALYRDWAESYDHDFAQTMDYQAPRHVAELFAAHAAGRDSPILDVGAGTGLIGAHLAELGLSGVHALDISPEMLAVAMGRGCYARSIEADLTARLPLPDDEFGGLVSAGTFTHGHVGPDAFDELLRVARAGALFVLAINAAVFDSAGFGATLARLPITGLTLHDRPIYGPDTDPAHRDDLARIAVFRSV
ncbi:MAG TPA: class I SAM-dependent methyltransferase [Aestuariivirgaceae bacterium]|nr:class I SAM-dependent methyltransferase [Aestuariivirgaceae bacterium]